MTLPRLSAATWADRAARGLPDEVRGPAVDPATLTIGQVHLGIGAFHRAHQAVCAEDAAAATGETGWGLLGVTQRSARVADQLGPQDGLYGVLTTGADATSLRVVGAVRGVAFPGRDTALVLDTVAAPTTHVVSLTVTEKGYRRAPDGRLDTAAHDVAADLASATGELRHDDDAATLTPIGLLVRGLVRRHRTSGAPLTVVSCDNLTDNGAVLAGLVTQALAAVPGADDVAAWVASCVRFPSSMVDRIVPATSGAHRAEAEALLGLHDEALVAGEPYFQWVVEDDFAGPRPAWEHAGATFTHDVAPFERAKLRILNATHSTLAYHGALRGYATIAEAVADPDLEALVRALVDEDVLPTLVAPDGLDLPAYRDEVLHRFANPRTGHTTLQVAMDGSQKLPVRLLGTVADRLAAGSVPHAAARAVAGWVAYLRATTTGELVVAGRRVTLDDPLAARLADAVTGPDPTDRVLALREVFPEHVAASSAFRDAVRAELRDLTLAAAVR
ncbi:mannitol dehydrogenase family protein [Cellulomonas dongxiuzhuiae]|uniref:mannitol dehydrogenase family protein n=1 Tax=Cellulomonas dongxiuzhuiae TaxID=2819979 RepID=UPI001AAE8BFE|nr:mannitol dehydrogenase family protein [Cellulomonas dongxiuzhuiae]MBO3088097.1 mannitol dehydrogenase family protein [Cellulomonas dongxiuzhuiae]